MGLLGRYAPQQPHFSHYFDKAITSAAPDVDMCAARMYNIVRLCPGRLLGRPFVFIPASPFPGVGAAQRSRLVAQGEW
jgi:hypothetical protein